MNIGNRQVNAVFDQCNQTANDMRCFINTERSIFSIFISKKKLFNHFKTHSFINHKKYSKQHYDQIHIIIHIIP